LRKAGIQSAASAARCAARRSIERAAGDGLRGGDLPVR
jgi:hypothetical protein